MAAKPAHRNIAVVVGTVAREPEPRELTDGTPVIELDIKVTVDGSSPATVPVSWVGAAASVIPAGTEVVVVGRVRRRFYRAGGGTVSRTDVLADAVIPATSAKRAATTLAVAADAIR